MAVLALALILIGCAAGRNIKTAQQPVSSPPSLIDASVGKATCEAIAQDFSEGDLQSIISRVDSSFLTWRVLKLFEKNPLTHEQTESIEKNLSDQLINMLSLTEERTRWSMLSGRVDGERYLCLVRSGLSNEGVKYVEFDLRLVDDRLRILDWYDLIRKARVSDLFVELFRDIDEIAFAHLVALPNVRASVAQEQKLYADFLKAARSGDAERVLKIYAKLPSRLQNKPLYIFIALNMASKLDVARYGSFLRDLARRVGDDDRYGMLLLDLYLADRQYEKADRVLRAFKRQIGSDAVLELLLANLERARGNKQAFYGYCLQALEADAAQLDTYWILLDQFVADRNYGDAVLILNVLSSMFQITLDDNALESDEKYQDFFRSAAFKEWMEKAT